MNAQLIKLARTLQVPVGQLGYLADVPDHDLRMFRDQVSDMLYERQAAGLRKIASAAKVIPAPITATLVTRTGNALLAARMAGVLDPSHAVDVAKRLPPEFLAEVAAQLDSRRAAPIIGSLPTKTVVAVAEKLAAKQDWVTLGDLVAVISDDATRATLAALDGEVLVRTAYLVDDQEQVARFIDLTTDSAIAGMLRAATVHDLWTQYRPLLTTLSDEARDRIRAAAAELEPEYRDRALTEIDTVGK